MSTARPRALGLPGHGELTAIGYLVFQGLGEVGGYELVDIFDRLVWFAEFDYTSGPVFVFAVGVPSTDRL